MAGPAGFGIFLTCLLKSGIRISNFRLLINGLMFYISTEYFIKIDKRYTLRLFESISVYVYDIDNLLIYYLFFECENYTSVFLDRALSVRRDTHTQIVCYRALREAWQPCSFFIILCIIYFLLLCF